MAPDRPPSGSSCTLPPHENPEPRGDCCAGSGRDAPGKAPGADNNGDTSLVDVRDPFCLSYTLSSIAGSRDLPESVRGNLESAPLRGIDPSFARLFAVFDHKESRAPPA